MMKITHRLKTARPFFNYVACGLKTFEFRRDDRAYSAGDFLILEEIDEKGDYTGQRTTVRVSYMLTHEAFPELPFGWVIMAIERR